jgi:hypothetical protein
MVFRTEHKKTLRIEKLWRAVVFCPIDSSTKFFIFYCWQNKFKLASAFL